MYPLRAQGQQGIERVPLSAGVQQLREASHGRYLEQRPDRQLNAQHGLYAGGQPDGQQGMPAQGEKVIIDPNPGQA
ncbi:MAG TPA: hypothetical protein VFO16_23275 [Pseudonocardiaceae bacterium]|nr:hypothetical protein [Pseudonocardiaceae bacterium]